MYALFVYYKRGRYVPDSAFDCLLPAWSSLESTLCFSLRFICTCSRAAQKLAAAFVNYFYAPFYLCCKKKKFGKVQKLASQATLISERLKNELDLNVDTKSAVTIRTLADQTTKSGGLAEFILQSLTTNEKFENKKALVVPEFTDDERTLPHAVNVKNLDHFKGVEIPVITERKSVDILIGQTDKLLLTVLEERESIHPDDPNYVLTRLGPIASGGLIGV